MSEEGDGVEETVNLLPPAGYFSQVSVSGH